MPDLTKESLVTLEKAANDFGGVPVPYETIRKYAYRGVKGLKLETVFINRRYTSKEAIQRFIDRRQGTRLEKPKERILTSKEVDAGLRKYGVRK
jgi:hypothetical protein